MSSARLIRPWRLLGISAIGLLLAGSGVYLIWPRNAAAPPLAHAHQHAQITPPGSNQATEEKWMATQIGQHIAETVVFARGKKLPKSEGLTFTATRPALNEQYKFVASMPGTTDVQSQFVLSDYFWSPANFIPWTQQLLAAWRPPVSPATPADLEIFERLATPGRICWCAKISEFPKR